MEDAVSLPSPVVEGIQGAAEDRSGLRLLKAASLVKSTKSPALDTLAGEMLF